MLALPAQGARRTHPDLRLLTILVAGILLSNCRTAVGQSEAPRLVRVEEDWELQLIDPDHTITAPQITCAMTVGSVTEGTYATFELNHQTQPSFETGGVHVHLWNGDYVRATRSQDSGVSLATNGEVISWTQVMAVGYGYLMFDISNGTSTTWGEFGQGSQLRIWSWTWMHDLNPYDPAVSVANSSVGFASNRVRKLVLKRVRLYTSDGQAYEDNTERVAHELP